MSLIKYNKEGKKHLLTGFTNSLFPGAYAIAADSEDNTYCVSDLSNKILCCDKNGGNVHVHEVQQVKGPGHIGVAVVGEEVMVTEFHNASTIMIYDKQFKYMRRYNKLEKENIVDFQCTLVTTIFMPLPLIT